MNSRNPIMITGVIAVLAVAGCDNKSASSENSGEQYPQETTASDVMDEVTEAAQAAGDFTTDKIDEYKNSARAELESIEESIESLAGRVENMGGEMKDEAQRALDDLRQKRDALAADIDEATADSMDAWNDVKAGLDRAWADLESATESAMERFGS